MVYPRGYRITPAPAERGGFFWLWCLTLSQVTDTIKGQGKKAREIPAPDAHKGDNMPKVTTNNPFSIPARKLPFLALTADLGNIRLIALPAENGFDVWFTGGGSIDSVHAEVTGRGMCGILAEVRIEDFADVAEARRFVRKLSGRKAFRGGA